MFESALSFFAGGILISAAATNPESSIWNFRDEMVPALVQTVPLLLKTQNPETGRFNSGIPIAADQTPIYTLAVAWSVQSPKNPYFHDPKLLNAIMRGGEVLAETQDKTGQWEFRKKDNSFWGMHRNPWVYSRWIRAFTLIRGAMPPERRAIWEKALTLGYSNIAQRELTRVHNIPAHHAMGLYIAGKTLNHPEWCEKAGAFLRKVADEQDENGFWTEHFGPVVSYNLVYVEALGIYYFLSHDEKVLPVLERSARFHANFVYPNGSGIETIDERNPYSAVFHLAGPGLSFSPIGRAYLAKEWQRVKNDRTVNIADLIASTLLYGQEGEVSRLPENNGDSIFISRDSRASVIREGPWVAALSAYVCPIEKNRWIQDRQNFISLFHKKTGLILGGGNTKLQPLWSTFTVGDVDLLKHKAGDKNPDFSEPAGLLHVPSNGALDPKGNFLQLRYGTIECSVRLTLEDGNKARLVYTAKPDGVAPVAAHVTFLPAVEKPWRTASGKNESLKTPFDLTAAQAGEWFEHNGWRVYLPPGSRLTWPALRHNPYRDDGRSDLADGRIVLTLPFSEADQTQIVTVELRE